MGVWSLVQRGQPHCSPPNTTTTNRGQLSYVGLTASVCCVLAVCLDSPALLSQQLNNRWLKKASIQRGLDQKIAPRKEHRLQTKHADTHTHANDMDCQTCICCEWENSKEGFACCKHSFHCRQMHAHGTHATECMWAAKTHARCCLITPKQLPATIQ